MTETAEFTELLGEHILTGVDMDSILITEGYNKGDEANLVRFTLDGITWEAIEGPEDGDRSCMGELQRSGVVVKNVFVPCRVMGKMHEQGFGVDNYIDFVDVETLKIVLSVGTANTEGYYPWFVGFFDPTTMAVNNQARSKKA